MATRTFLSPDQVEFAKKEFFLDLKLSSIRKSFSEPRVQKISHWLGEQLFAKFKEIPDWELSEPIALGSWARQELCPRSDIDLLFLGPEKFVVPVVQSFQEAGWPIRSRVPKDLDDWSKGVDSFDVLALKEALPLCAASKLKLEKQRPHLESLIRRSSRKYLRAMLKERKERSERHDSMTNYLEPNLKFGPGGLRDVGQAFNCLKLFPSSYTKRPDIIQRLRELQDFLLFIRQGLHLFAYSDVLVAQAQLDLCKHFSYLGVQDFMSEVQYALSETSFYADWVLEQAQVRTPSLLPKKWSLNSALSFLSESRSRIHQERVRSADLSLPNRKSIGRILNRYWLQRGSEGGLLASFRAKIPHRIFPELQKVEGLVQHDQYHRYSVDAHLLQVMREVLRLKTKPSHLGPRMKSYVQGLSGRDWEILFWTAFFHDLCKGQQGDHEALGEKLVKREMTALGFSLRTTVEVAWMVRHHLVLSQAAFRKNPRDPHTWEKLFDLGVRGRRIVNLGIFTALDIRGTNFEAWNDWKEGLLVELVGNLLSPTASKYLKVVEAYEKANKKVDRSFFNALDPRLLEKLAVRHLAEDAEVLPGLKHPASPKVISEGKNRYWIRFHWPKDEDGLFLKFVQALHSVGASVSEAYIQTFAQQGVYDWFCVRSSNPRTMLVKLLEKTLAGAVKPDWPEPKFEKVSLVEHLSDEAILSFRGKDQRGALMGAAHALYDSGMPIIWAKVNTWGRQLDDVFAVRATDEKIQEFFESEVPRLLE